MTVTPFRPSDAGKAPASTAPDSNVLRSVSQRVLWLAAAIVDAANRSRPNQSGVKVGGAPGIVGLDGRHHGRVVIPLAAPPGTGSR